MCFSSVRIQETKQPTAFPFLPWLLGGSDINAMFTKVPNLFQEQVSIILSILDFPFHIFLFNKDGQDVIF